AQIRGQRDFWHAFIKRDTPAARDEIIEVLTKYTPVKDPQQWGDAIMPGVGLNGELSDALVEDYQSYFVKVGSQRELIPAAQVVDPPPVGEPLARRGRESY